MTVRVCPTCEGSGEVRFNRSHNHDPQHDDSETCPRCDGAGVVPSALEDRHAA